MKISVKLDVILLFCQLAYFSRTLLCCCCYLFLFFGTFLCKHYWSYGYLHLFSLFFVSIKRIIATC